jgi:hypothetical protein
MRSLLEKCASVSAKGMINSRMHSHISTKYTGEKKGNIKTDKERLRTKLTASIAERKKVMRKELIRKNSIWVNAALPAAGQKPRKPSSI